MSHRGMNVQRFTVYLGPGALSAFVAGAGVEPAHLLVMSQTPYQLGHPAVAQTGLEPAIDAA